MEKPVYSIRCQSNLSALAPIRSLVHEMAIRSGFPEKVVHEIEMSVDEACANAIEHVPNNQENSANEFQLDILENADELVFIISDKGEEMFNADSLNITFESYLVADRDNFRGLGLMLMKKFMDEVCFLSTPETGTTVKLVKRK